MLASGGLCLYLFFLAYSPWGTHIMHKQSIACDPEDVLSLDFEVVDGFRFVLWLLCAAAGCQARRWDRQASLNAHRLTTHRPQQNHLDPANQQDAGIKGDAGRSRSGYREKSLGPFSFPQISWSMPKANCLGRWALLSILKWGTRPRTWFLEFATT